MKRPGIINKATKRHKRHKKLGVLNEEHAQLSVASARLELEAGSELHLTLTEQRAVSTGYIKERVGSHSVEGQRVTRLVIDSWVDVSDLGTVENVESFSQQFELDTFSQAESSRKPCIDVPNVWLLEEITWHQRKARRATRTIY